MRIYKIYPTKSERKVLLASGQTRLISVEFNLDRKEMLCEFFGGEVNYIPFEAFIEHQGQRPDFKNGKITDFGQTLQLGGGYEISSLPLLNWDEAQDRPIKPNK